MTLTAFLGWFWRGVHTTQSGCAQATGIARI